MTAGFLVPREPSAARVGGEFVREALGMSRG